MAEAIAAVLGWGVLLAAFGAVALAVGRRAASHGILVPLLVGVGLRLAVMLIAHAGSLSLGDRGLLFIDDQTYFYRGGVLANLWRGGHFPDPTRHDVLGTYQFGYQMFVGTLFTLGTTSVLLGKLVNVVAGGVTVYLVARIAGHVLGERAQVRAAWLAALAPSLVWWSAPLMKEALCTMLLMLGVLAIATLPRWRSLVTLAVLVPTFMILRSSAVLTLVVAAGVAIALAGRRAARWFSRPLLVLSGTLLVGGLAVALAESHGDLQQFYDHYRHNLSLMFHLYQGGNLSHLPYDVVKSLVTPVPWAFDSATRDWDRALYPGVWLLFCAYPLAVVGAWRLRGRPELGLLVGTVVAALVTNALTAGFVFRQRSMIEPLILLLALAGATSWQMAARWSSATLGVVAVVAVVHTQSPLVGGLVAAAASALFLAAPRLPSDPFEPLPDSAMVVSFRTSLAPSASGGGRAKSRTLGPIAKLPRATDELDELDAQVGKDAGT